MEITYIHNYPDSVSLVNPPNTTIPKTLAALPKSQYAAALSLISGKEFDLGFARFAADSTLIVLLKAPRGDVVLSTACFGAWVVCDLKAWRKGVRQTDLNCGRNPGGGEALPHA